MLPCERPGSLNFKRLVCAPWHTLRCKPLQELQRCILLTPQAVLLLHLRRRSGSVGSMQLHLLALHLKLLPHVSALV